MRRLSVWMGIGAVLLLTVGSRADEPNSSSGGGRDRFSRRDRSLRLDPQDKGKQTGQDDRSQENNARSGPPGRRPGAEPRGIASAPPRLPRDQGKPVTRGGAPGSARDGRPRGTANPARPATPRTEGRRGPGSGPKGSPSWRGPNRGSEVRSTARRGSSERGSARRGLSAQRSFGRKSQFSKRRFDPRHARTSRSVHRTDERTYRGRGATHGRRAFYPGGGRGRHGYGGREHRRGGLGRGPRFHRGDGRGDYSRHHRVTWQRGPSRRR